MMDLQSALVCILVVVVSAAILLLISMFGMKEKSYEEALAEQRKITNGLLGTGPRPKPKEKKQKKAGKKVKEKSVAITAQTEVVEEEKKEDAPVPEVVASTPPVSVVKVNSIGKVSEHPKMHVEFEEPAVVDIPQITNKKRSKKEKMRSILLNKETCPISNVDITKPLPVNHFETIHPKDEFELLHSQQKEEVPQKPNTKAVAKHGKSKQPSQVVEQSEPPKTAKQARAQKQPSQVVEQPELPKAARQTGAQKQPSQVVEQPEPPKAAARQSGAQKQPSQIVEQPKAVRQTGPQKQPSQVVDQPEPPKAAKQTGAQKQPSQVVEQPESPKGARQARTQKQTSQAVEQPEPPKAAKQQRAQKQQAPQPPVVEEKQAEPVAIVKLAPVAKLVPVVQQPAVNSVKDKKKKKSEFNTLQQMSGGDRSAVNVSLLVPLVRKADLSRSEIQILIDLLLNKQHEAPTILDEWSEGKSDPIQKLKKQLAEKERALTNEQEAASGAHAKLRELRAELNSERSRLLQNCRNLEESLHAKHTELQSMLARHHTQNQKMQQMQAQLNEEMQQKQLQRQQMEMHLASISDQKQEADATFQSQLSQVRVELQELQNLNDQLTMELHTLSDKGHAEKEMLHDRIRQLESQAHHFKNEFDQKQDIVRQLEESRRKYSELEHSFGVSHRKENELKIICQQHLEEARRLEVTQVQAHDELNRLQSEITRLTSSNKQQQDESDKLIAQLRTEISQIQNEKTKLEAVNDAASTNIEILNLQNELASMRAQLQQKEQQMAVELETTQKSVQEMEIELVAQRNKNDELRKKNWKVMEALNTAENTIRTKPKEAVSDINEIKNKIKQEEQENNRKFLQRLFPDVNIPNSEQWMTGAEMIIKSHMSSLKTRTVPSDDGEVNKLQAQIAHYQIIIDDTEGMLNKLQTHVEHEERNWRNELREKNAEIETLKEYNKKQKPTEHLSPESSGVQFAFSCIEKTLPCVIEELQAIIEELESKLAAEEQTRRELEIECESLKTKVVTIPASQSRINNAEERTLKENEVLSEALTKEQQRCHDLSDELLRLQSGHTDSLHSKSPQNHTSNGTSLGMIESESASSN